MNKILIVSSDSTRQLTIKHIVNNLIDADITTAESIDEAIKELTQALSAQNDFDVMISDRNIEPKLVLIAKSLNSDYSVDNIIQAINRMGSDADTIILDSESGSINKNDIGLVTGVLQMISGTTPHKIKLKDSKIIIPGMDFASGDVVDALPTSNDGKPKLELLK